MTAGRFRLHLRANERVFINGAVLKVDRKVAIEMLNDAVFLLEHHVMQQENATTPLRRLYFVVQSLILEPQTAQFARQVYEQSHHLLLAANKNRDVLEGLVEVRALVDNRRIYEAMKRLRALFVHDDDMGGEGGAVTLTDEAAA